MTTPTSQPKISDDGKFSWDGSRWVPRPQPRASAPRDEPQVVRVKEGSGKAIFMLAIIALVIGFVVAII